MEERASKLCVRKSVIGGDAEYLAREIAQLSALEDVPLRRRWAALFQVDPSPNFSRLFMLRSSFVGDDQSMLPVIAPKFSV